MAARNTLNRQVALRLAGALVLAGCLAVGLALLISGQATERLFASSARQLAEHLSRSISRYEIDWERAAYNFKARLEFSRVLEDPAHRRERLFNFVTAQGGSQEFDIVAIHDLGGQRLAQYAYNRDVFPSAEFDAGDVGWAFDAARAALFRVYRTRVWLGPEGNGVLHLYRPVDHSVLGALVYPGTELYLFWGDTAVASSLGASGLEQDYHAYVSATAAGIHVQPWGQVSPGASRVVSVSRPQAAVAGRDLLEPVGMGMIAFALTAWMVLGAWVTGAVRRVGALGRAQTGFAAARALAPAVHAALRDARGGADDEVSDTAASLETMMRAVIEHERRQEESADALRHSEERFRLLVEGTQAIAWELDVASGRLVYASPRLTGLLACSEEASAAPGFLAKRTEPEDLERVTRARLRRGPDGGTIDFRLVRGDGEHVWVRELSSTTGAGDGLRVRGIWVDMTETKLVEQRLRLAGLVFDTAAEGIVVTDAENRIISVNPAFESITGYGADEVLGRDPRFLASGRHGPEFYAGMWAAIEQDGHWSGEVWNRRKSGEFYAEHLSISAVRDATGRRVRHLALFNDVTTEKRQAERIEHQAGHDALTGLPNRRLLADRMTKAIHLAERDGAGIGVVMLDLDGFKQVNDTLGHRVGDLLLIEASRRLVHSVRESDTVARVGGDEFVLMLPHMQEQRDLQNVARKVLEHLREPFSIEGSDLFLSCSIGITLFPDDGDSPDALVAHADAAMYLAKAEGKNTFRFFTREMHDEALERMRLEQQLRRAIEEVQFELVYQPIVAIDSARVTGAEALVRWRHPEHGVLLPARFMPLAEDSGLVVPLGDWIARTAVGHARRWRAVAPPGFRVGVNMSPRQFKTGDCVVLLRELLPAHEDAAALCIEITERLFLDERYDARRQLDEIRALGLCLSIDDFGTGYSSLSYLKRFPVDTLKIDRSFVAGLPGDREDVALVEAILAMSRALGIDVVAEGVETGAQRQFLRDRGCGYAQGLLFGAPVPAHEFERRFLSRPVEAA